MKKDVLIELKSSVEANGESESLEITTRGKLLKKDDSLFITYKETDQTGFDGCSVLIRVDGEQKASVTRNGDAPSHLIIEKGKRNVCAYNTPFTTAMLGISGARIRKKEENDETRLFISYELDLNAELMSRNELSIKIREI